MTKYNSTIWRRAVLLSFFVGTVVSLYGCGGGGSGNVSTNSLNTNSTSVPFVFTKQPKSVTVTYSGAAVGVDFSATVSDDVKTAEWFESRDGGVTWKSLGYTGNSLDLGFFVNSVSYNKYRYKIVVSNYDGIFITSDVAILNVLG
jgi:hypothetical protein